MNDEREIVRVGQITLGVIKSFTSLGALVMLPKGLTGNIPRDEISWLRKKAVPEEFFKRGQEVRAKIIEVKRTASGAIIVTLSCRALQENPWLKLEDMHPRNSRTTARVVDFLPFGATVQLPSGFQALLHDSEISWSQPIPQADDKRQRKVNAADFLRIGETIEVVIQDFEVNKRKIWVSHKLTQPWPWDSVAHDYPPQSRTCGFVVNIAKFGHFVQLPNGCVGLLHESDAPDGTIEEYGLGDEIPVLVLRVDDDQRRISLALDISVIEHVETPATFAEGRRRVVVINYYERNPKARRACIAHYGALCVVCGMDFAHIYGNVADGFIHVHHLKPISEIGDVYQLDPIQHLRPVCPNCHAVIHLRTPPYTIDEVTAFFTRDKRAAPTGSQS